MNSGTMQMPDGETRSQSSSHELTAGAMLRAAREASGLHIAALAVSMKIPVKKLEALESDRLDLLHDVVFVRALAAGVCRNLKLDPLPVLAKLPGASAPKLDSVEGGINAPFRVSGNAGGFAVSPLLGKPAALIVLVLLVGVLLVYFFPDMRASDRKDVLDAPPASPNAAVDAPVANPSATASPSATDRIIAPMGEGSLKSGELSAVKPVDPIVEAAAPAGVVGSALVLKAKAASWVQVVDVRGAVVLSKTMAKDEILGVPGETPLSVVVGRSDAMDVEVRGKPLTLADYTKDNVARFEVK